MKDILITKETFVMCTGASPDFTIEKANQIFDEIKTEKDVATLFSLVYNKAWWIADEEYDFDEGTEEHKKRKKKKKTRGLLYRIKLGM